jgi:hypothetical protein
MRTLILITLLFLGSLVDAQSQSFEGKIIYRLSIESADLKRITASQIEMMFNDADTTCILYFKGDQYKLITLDRESGKVKTVNQFVPVSNKIIDYVLTDSPGVPFVMQTENTPNINVFKKRKINEDQISILGEPCDVIVLDYGSHSTTLFFSNKNKINARGIRADAPSFLQYLRECQSIPLKIVISGGGAVHNLVFEATEITQGPVDDAIFLLPK